MGCSSDTKEHYFIDICQRKNISQTDSAHPLSALYWLCSHPLNRASHNLIWGFFFGILEQKNLCSCDPCARGFMTRWSRAVLLAFGHQELFAYSEELSSLLEFPALQCPVSLLWPHFVADGDFAL